MTAEALACRRYGAGERIVLVHGFTQTGRSWDPIVGPLSEHFEVVAVDAPGHGGSSEVRAELPAAAELLGRTGGPATYVGYSMGGRICLHLALARPELVRRLVLVSTTAGIDDDTERAARRRTDEELAASIEAGGVDAFLDRWLALPLFATLDRAAAGVDERRRNTSAGLASSLRLAGTGRQQSVWDRLDALMMPTLVVAGADDSKFFAIAHRLAATIPHATLEVVDGAGHAVHLEQPELFALLLTRWLTA